MKTFGDHFILDKLPAEKLSTPIEMLHYSMTMPLSVFVARTPPVISAFPLRLGEGFKNDYSPCFYSRGKGYIYVLLSKALP